MPVPIAFVLALQSRLPNECALTGQCPKTAAAHYDRVHDAKAIREAVSLLATDEEEAAEAVEYAAYESTNRLNAVGDHGQSVGAWQISVQKLRGAEAASSEEEAERQLTVWLAMRRTSLDTCGDLTWIASGQCRRGQRLVRRREVILAAVLPQALAMAEVGKE